METVVWTVWYVWHASVWAVWSNTHSYPPDCSHRYMQNIPYCIYMSPWGWTQEVWNM